MVFPLNPTSDDEFWTSKLKEVADNNLKCDKNGRRFFKWVENTVGKGEKDL